MTPGGWLTMLLSVGAAAAFFAWCTARVLMARDASKTHSPDEADDADLEGDDEADAGDASGNAR